MTLRTFRISARRLSPSSDGDEDIVLQLITSCFHQVKCSCSSRIFSDTIYDFLGLKLSLAAAEDSHSTQHSTQARLLSPQHWAKARQKAQLLESPPLFHRVWEIRRQPSTVRLREAPNYWIHEWRQWSSRYKYTFKKIVFTINCNKNPTALSHTMYYSVVIFIYL